MPWIPEAPCIDTTQFSNGIHTLSIESTCGGHEFVMTHEFFHWFQDHFMADMKGNAGPWPESGAFGEGFCTMMPTMLDGSRHRIEKNLLR